MQSAKKSRLVFTVLFVLGMIGCGGNQQDLEELSAKPRSYVGSEQCKVCHLEHYDSWQSTLHSRTIQSVSDNLDALITDIDPKVIRADLLKSEKKPQIPIDEIYIPKLDEIKFVIGIQWKQRYLVEKDGALYIAPLEYDIRTNSWHTYHPTDWADRPWAQKCGGCHSTGIDLGKNIFSEAKVGCEACHGPGSHHIALPKTAVFEKRLTIINPSKLSAGLRTQICGSCHAGGESTRIEDVDWPSGYRPGRALRPYYNLLSQAAKESDSNYLTDRHHEQYNDWENSIHAQKGVSCTSCHYVHQLGLPPTQFQTMGAGSGQCLTCHTGNKNKFAHSIHSFDNCIGCHMPNLELKNASQKILSHTFKFLSPVASLKAGGVEKQPNSCNNCHHHAKTPLSELIGFLEAAQKKDLPKPLAVHRRTEPVEK